MEKKTIQAAQTLLMAHSLLSDLIPKLMVAKLIDSDVVELDLDDVEKSVVIIQQLSVALLECDVITKEQLDTVNTAKNRVSDIVRSCAKLLAAGMPEAEVFQTVQAKLEPLRSILFTDEDEYNKTFESLKDVVKHTATCPSCSSEEDEPAVAAHAEPGHQLAILGRHLH